MPSSEDDRWLSSDEWSTYKRLIGFSRVYLSRLVAGCILGAVAGGAWAYVLNILRKGVDGVVSLDRNDPQEFYAVVILFPVVAIILGIAQFASAYLIQWVGNRVVLDVRRATFDHLLELPAGYFSRQKTGELISRTVNDSTMLERAVSTVLGDLAEQPFKLLGAFGYLIFLDWRLALGTFILLPLSMLPIAHYGKRVRRFGREGQEWLGELVSTLQEALSGIRIVQAFGMEKRESNRFNREATSYFRRIMKVTKAKASIQPIIQVIATLGVAGVWIYCYHAQLSAGEMFAFGVGLVLMYDPVKKLGRIHLNIQQSSAAADRIFEILDSDVQIRDREGAIEFDGGLQSVEFRDVRFAYDDTPVLRGINLRVEAGERVALVGGSGAGKTTLANLVPRFYDVSDGQVLLNDQDVRDYQLKSLRKHIGVVTQDTVLFHDTIRNNIAYGTDDASDEQIEEAARRAHAHEFIQEMKSGYDSVIGDRGVLLSGGQKQRLAIARAILRNPPIMILDEATNALDTESERQVQAALDELMEGRTVIAIAHRLSTIVTCDKILVLESGEVVESGKHEELIALNGKYKRLYDMQFEDAPSGTEE